MHESDPYPYDDAYDPAAVRNQRMERRRREQRRRWRRLLVVCTLVAAVPLLIYGLWRTGRTVSYTHLDVYKRQEREAAEAGSPYEG